VSSFSPLDHKLALGTEGYSLAVLQKAIRQVQKARSSQDASADLAELLLVCISPSHLRNLAKRIGQEWAKHRDADIQAFKDGTLPSRYAEAPRTAAVMVDGGTLQDRQDNQPRGVHEPGWREYKAACCLTLSAPVSAQDPQPEPPRKFLDPVRAARLAAEMKARRGKSATRSVRQGKNDSAKKRRRRKGKGKKRRRWQKVRTVVASMASSEEFGWQVAAEVQRRGLDKARNKAYVCDGQKYNWTIYEMHFLAWGFIGILDFAHLLSYLYWSAQAAEGKGTQQAWTTYERWLRWAWGGQVEKVIEELQSASQRLGAPPGDCAEEDPRRVVAEALGYLRNNRARMDYPRYRRLGLPIGSAGVESTIKQLNARVKGSEKFWLEQGAEALLVLRAAHLSEDDSVQRYWDRPRPYPRAVGANRLRPPS
jgi:hypothetical protein